MEFIVVFKIAFHSCEINFVKIFFVHMSNTNGISNKSPGLEVSMRVCGSFHDKAYIL